MAPLSGSTAARISSEGTDMIQSLLLCTRLTACSTLCFCLLFLPPGSCEYGTERSAEAALCLSVLKFFFLLPLFAAQYQKNSADTCPCETPCNLTRYGKELSMVKIPSKGSARYLSRKYDKSEDYIRCVGGSSETKL